MNPFLPRGLAIILLAPAVLSHASSAAAQDRDVPGVLAVVETDKKDYAFGETVRLRVGVWNPTEEPVRIRFPSAGHKADYDVDGEHLWSGDKTFIAMPSIETLEPGESRTLGSFEHTPDDHVLKAGTHVITGIVVGYARASARIRVHAAAATRLSLRGEAIPPRPGPGDPVAFRLTVTNRSDSTVSFTTGGCPVFLTIDDVFTPRMACTAIARSITLAPGDVHVFDAETALALRHKPEAYPLAPGPHRVELAVPRVGAAGAELHVGEPAPDVAYLAGRLTLGHGAPVRGAEIVLSASNGARPGGGLRTKTSDQGYFFLGSLPPGSYLLRAELGDRTVGYGTSPDGTLQPLALRGGTYERIRFVVDPPSTPRTGVLEGRVVEDPSDTGQNGPVGGAAVLAVPVEGEHEDDAAEPRGRAVTGDDGRFRMELPAGSYRVVAGKLVTHGYRYWMDAERLGEAAEVAVVPASQADSATAIGFRLPRLGEAHLAGIRGIVLAYDPFHDAPPEPLAGAWVLASPVLPSALADAAPLRATTRDDGTFTFELPADTPYRLSAAAKGYRTQFFRNARRSAESEWVDVEPGKTAPGVRFLLQPAGSEEGPGVIEGSAFLAGEDCADSSGCGAPAAGALVRVAPAYPTFAPDERRTRVGRDGRFRVEGLAAQPDGGLAYYVSVEDRDRPPAYYPGGVDFPHALPLPVFPGRPADAGRIVLGRKAPSGLDGFLQGRVRTPEGDPVEHAEVRVYPYPVASPHAHLARTDAGGRFLVRGLPQGSEVLVSAAAEGFLPAYHPGVHRWTDAAPVAAAGPAIRTAPLEIVLVPNVSAGPHLQVGLVRARAGEDLAGPGALLLLQHQRNLPGAFFYLVNASSGSVAGAPVSGASTPSNGTALLTGLPEGSYLAYADRPGYATAYFRMEGEEPRVIRLDGSTPALLAEIVLAPAEKDEEGAENEAPSMVVNPFNSPNPFRPNTTIFFDLVEPSEVTVQVFDYRGRLVRTLVTGLSLSRGGQSLPWDGTDEDGRRVSSGVYFYRIETPSEATSRKMVLLP